MTLDFQLKKGLAADGALLLSLVWTLKIQYDGA